MRAEPVHPLTYRELQVVERVVQGLPAKQIAADLGLSVHTVQHYVATISLKVPAPSGSARTRILLWWHGVAA